VLPCDHRIAEGAACRSISLNQLKSETWISGAPGIPNRTCLEALARHADVVPRVAYESADYHVILALVGAGLGIALVPESILADASRSRVSVHHLHGLAPAREISIVHRRRPTTLVGELAAFLHTAAGDASQLEGRHP
jgi:DNA-binding transcriptional LysR family regulator